MLHPRGGRHVPAAQECVTEAKLTIKDGGQHLRQKLGQCNHVGFAVLEKSLALVLTPWAAT